MSTKKGTQAARRAVVYARSASLAPDLASVEEQFANCHRAAARHSAIVEEEFRDVDCPGTTLERPALQKLLGRVSAGKIDYVITDVPSDLSRDPELFFNLIQQLARHNAKVLIAHSDSVLKLNQPESHESP